MRLNLLPSVTIVNLTHDNFRTVSDDIMNYKLFKKFIF